MRIAIILTGALRTIRKTISFFKQNLLDANHAHEVDVFVCVQNDSHHLDTDWERWFDEQIHPTTLTWFSLQIYHDWVEQRERLLQHMSLDPSWKTYLRRSGSMIEYAQLHIASMKMTQWEHDHGSYDYVVRARTDSIFCKPIDFHWLQWTDEQVESRILSVMYGITDTSKMIPYFMSTMISNDTLPNLAQIHANHYPSDADALVKTVWDTRVYSPAALNTYIKEGRYILTFRKNNLYIVKRSLFHLIPALGTMYGQFKSPYSDAWWFNAEGQFTSICYHAGLTTYDYDTDLEDRSVEANGWKQSDFFDEEMNLIHTSMVFCMVRQ